MKTATIQYFTILFIFALMMIKLPSIAFAAEQDTQVRSTAMNAAGNTDHETLAHYYEDQAKEMQAKIQEQVEAINHKPSTSFLGRNGQRIKKHVVYKIHEFEKAAAENLQKAAYHNKMAEKQKNRKQFAESGKIKG
ncbi:hypothetical protein SAMN05216302_10202 [Nitrosomonas aestuarii]|uniref:Uncharacterized protein n=1 Tax=Nitrosomonas aestuarii TaxID=52441 RepID=A0A1I4DCI4_9PROT|nr:hypothetical protein [Nitrosomonas aestuarii]SFK89826.1 hypothetical protein SAMN05216302_10202 [Nitrosomonas aestuarii]